MTFGGCSTSSRRTFYDAAGHTSSYGSLAFTYNDRGRVVSTNANSTNYLYSALGQMIEKSGTSGTAVFMPDESGHLLGEYSGSGGLVEERIWLGDIPVATLQPNGSGGVNIFYVHTKSPQGPAQGCTADDGHARLAVGHRSLRHRGAESEPGRSRYVPLQHQVPRAVLPGGDWALGVAPFQWTLSS
jgi:hypothetical protein